jgi:hypothetical protein
MPDEIYTEQALTAVDIFEKVSEPLAQALFYQCLFHVEFYTHVSHLLRAAKDELDFQRFARAQSSHMTEGIFGDLERSFQMETAKIKVMGYLGATVSSGHKFLRSLKNARTKDGDPAWKPTRKRLIQLEESYRLARNAFEHLDESILRGETLSDEDFSFSIYNKLYFRNQSRKHEFDFSAEVLGEVNELWEQTTKIIRARSDT